MGGDARGESVNSNGTERTNERTHTSRTERSDVLKSNECRRGERRMRAFAHDRWWLVVCVVRVRVCACMCVLVGLLVRVQHNNNARCSRLRGGTREIRKTNNTVFHQKSSWMYIFLYFPLA